MFHVKWTKLEHDLGPRNAGCTPTMANVPNVPVQNVKEKWNTVHGQLSLYNLEMLEHWNIGTPIGMHPA